MLGQYKENWYTFLKRYKGIWVTKKGCVFMYACVREDESIIRMLLSNLIRVDSALKLTWERVIRYRTFSLTLPAFMLFIGTKGSVCKRREFNSHKIDLGHQHGRRFIVLGHQYGRPLMPFHAINVRLVFKKSAWHAYFFTWIIDGLGDGILNHSKDEFWWADSLVSCKREADSWKIYRV